MAVSDETLAQPLEWRDTALWPMLDDLQGNILKGHGRDHTMNHFLRFDSAKIAAVKGQIQAIGTQVTSAIRQLHEAEAFREFGRPGGTNVFFFLSASGYAKLGITPPSGDAFKNGMDSRSLGDPSMSEWETHFQHIDALLIVADDSVTKVANAAAHLTARFQTSGIEIVGVDAGHALRSDPSLNEPKGRGIEHFGYVDGRSQPLLLVDEVQREISLEGEFSGWDPQFGPGDAALVRDPGGKTPDSFGSFLVYRKLEQNVRDFKLREKALAAELGLTGDDDERAGAMVVGRFEDGTPLISAPAATDPNPTPNNFNYDDDPLGLKCPIHAHVRKVNPRVPNDAEQRSHLMPRRGIPFGDPDRDLEDEDSFPTGGVGLLFMAYNKELERQFEVTQQFWANSFDFPNGTAHGADGIMGQGINDDQMWNSEYGEPGEEKPFRFANFVTMRGGGYFFAPSKSFLKTLIQ
ncbi:Dyp-type peroxidase [Sphingomonas sp. BIUV-7]|uniref:Dyp-type peroxidase n=1 Tax=Sphingomonas natans TaxID=3063330 RepID=A0ABT8Y8H3_9SPHN|nr:Dyp-type peroxidase domain-containing protein [Sphingomonas sp. BIUV-7]MDO6414619.1 Dyp-type peroxidase [Sphingomonas sp. BIUV-7]